MTASYDQIADRYDEARGGDARGREIADAIGAWLTGRSVLEVCIGTGVVAAALAADGFAVTGVDLSPLMARRAVERIGRRVALGDALRLPIASSSVHSVTIPFGLHLVGDVGATLAECARVVRADGRVVAVHPAPTELDDSDIQAAQTTLQPAVADRPDTDEAIDAAARAAGLSLIHRGWTPLRTHARTPRSAADSIEQRAWWYVLKLDDEQFARLAAPAVRRLRALPDQDRPRPFRHRNRVTVLAR